MDSHLLETAGVALATLFATIGPLDVAAVFAALTARSDPRYRRTMAIRGVLIAAGILVGFALVGEKLLTGFGISLAALRTAGGILLLLIGIDLVFARSSGGTSTTAEEEREAATRQDISVFPLATPLIAGPGAMVLGANDDAAPVCETLRGDRHPDLRRAIHSALHGHAAHINPLLVSKKAARW